MYHLIYVSSAVNLFTDEQLKQLLEVSRTNNGKRNITGMLLYLDGNFIQVLEGEQTAVIETHQRIARDPRHKGLMTLLQGNIPEREFSDWSMGFRNVESNDGDSLPGYTDFLRKGAGASEQKTAALLLLNNFKKINR